MGWDRGEVTDGVRVAQIAFDRTGDRCYTAMHSVLDERVPFEDRVCACGAKPLSVLIRVRSYGGSSWLGTACWSCMCIVDGAAMPGGSAD